MDTIEQRVERIIRQMLVFEEGDSIVVELRDNLPPSTGQHLTAQYCSARMSDYDATQIEEIPEDISDNTTGFRLFYSKNGTMSGEISVHPAHRGNDFGRGFIDIAEQIAREFGIKELRVESPNIDFFRHFGYEILGDYAVKKLK